MILLYSRKTSQPIGENGGCLHENDVATGTANQKNTKFVQNAGI